MKKFWVALWSQYPDKAKKNSDPDFDLWPKIEISIKKIWLDQNLLRIALKPLSSEIEPKQNSQPNFDFWPKVEISISISDQKLKF